LNALIGTLLSSRWKQSHPCGHSPKAACRFNQDVLLVHSPAPHRRVDQCLATCLDVGRAFRKIQIRKKDKEKSLEAARAPADGRACRKRTTSSLFAPVSSARPAGMIRAPSRELPAATCPASARPAVGKDVGMARCASRRIGAPSGQPATLTS
jgi:hypothetical protein